MTHTMKKHSNPKLHIPIYVPAEGDREPKTVVAEGALHNGKLTITFNDRLPAQALQRMIANEILLGLAFVLIKAEPEPNGVTLEEATGTTKENN